MIDDYSKRPDIDSRAVRGWLRGSKDRVSERYTRHLTLLTGRFFDVSYACDPSLYAGTLGRSQEHSKEAYRRKS